MSIAEFIQNKIIRPRLQKTGSLVVYDPFGHYQDVCKGLADEKLLVVDENFHCTGLITVKDMEKAITYPDATKDATGRLRVAAATTVGGVMFVGWASAVRAEVSRSMRPVSMTPAATSGWRGQIHSSGGSCVEKLAAKKRCRCLQTS